MPPLRTWSERRKPRDEGGRVGGCASVWESKKINRAALKNSGAVRIYFQRVGRRGRASGPKGSAAERLRGGWEGRAADGTQGFGCFASEGGGSWPGGVDFKRGRGAPEWWRVVIGSTSRGRAPNAFFEAQEPSSEWLIRREVRRGARFPLCFFGRPATPRSRRPPPPSRRAPRGVSAAPGPATNGGVGGDESESPLALRVDGFASGYCCSLDGMTLMRSPSLSERMVPEAFCCSAVAVPTAKLATLDM